MFKNWNPQPEPAFGSSHYSHPDTYKVGQKVWQPTRDIPLRVESPKLATRYLGPLQVQRIVNSNTEGAISDFSWCALQINASKTKEMVVDFRRKSPPYHTGEHPGKRHWNSGLLQVLGFSPKLQTGLDHKFWRPVQEGRKLPPPV